MNTIVKYVVRLVRGGGSVTADEFKTFEEAKKFADDEYLSLDGDRILDDVKELELFIDREVYNEDEEMIEDSISFQKGLYKINADSEYIWRAEEQKVEVIEYYSDGEVKKRYFVDNTINYNNANCFIIQKSSKNGFWVATHKTAKIVIEFEQGKFNETQKVTMLEDFNASEIFKVPTYMRELGEWLAIYHRDKV